jgi:hypothetical protein
MAVRRAADSLAADSSRSAKIAPGNVLRQQRLQERIRVRLEVDLGRHRIVAVRQHVVADVERFVVHAGLAIGSMRIACGVCVSIDSKLRVDDVQFTEARETSVFSGVFRPSRHWVVPSIAGREALDEVAAKIVASAE